MCCPTPCGTASQRCAGDCSRAAQTRFSGDDLRKGDPQFQAPRFAGYLAAVRELDALAHERFGRTVLQLAVRRVLDQGPTIALWGARRPGQLDPVAQIDGWHIDESSRADIDAILRRHVPDAVAPDFMAPPAKRPLGTCVPPARPGGQARWQAQQFPR